MHRTLERILLLKYWTYVSIQRESTFPLKLHFYDFIRSVVYCFLVFTMASPFEEETNKHLKAVWDSLSRVSSSSHHLSEVILIEGSCGERKNHLIHTLRQELERRNAYVVRLHIDRIEYTHALSPAITCVKKIFEICFNSPHKHLILNHLKEEVSMEELNTVAHVIPDFFDLLNDQASKSETQAIVNPTIFESHLVQHALRSILRVIYTELVPFVILVEDIHRASPVYLKLLTRMILSPNAKLRRQIIFTTQVSKQTSTGGVPDILHAFSDSSSISFHHIRIDEGPVGSANYVRMIIKCIDTLSDEQKKILMISSKLGSQMEAKLLQSVIMVFDQIDQINLTQPLKVVTNDTDASIVQESLLSFVSKGIMEFSDGTYNFVDDSVYESTLCLLNSDPNNAIFFFKVGRAVYHLSHGKSNLLLPAVVLLNDAKEILPKQCQLVLAQLNLKSAQQAAQGELYEQAACFTRKGLVILGFSKWNTEYALSLELTTMLAEMSLALRDYVACKAAVDEVILNATSVEDKKPVYLILLQSLQSQARYSEAIDLGIQLLQLMGEKVKNSSFRIGLAAPTSRSQFNKFAPGFLDRPSMQDPIKLEICKLLYLLGEMAWINGDIQLAMQLHCRIVNITFKYGPCEFSAQGFAALGVFFRLNDYFEDAKKSSQLAHALIEKFPTANSAMTKALMAYHVDHWSQPYRAALEVDMSFYKRAAGHNLVSIDLFSRYVQLSLSLLRGDKLSPLSEKYGELIEEGRRYGESFTVMRLQPEYQFVLNLTGESRNVLVMSGTSMTEETYLAECFEMNVDSSIFNYQKMRLSYYFNQYEKAHEAKLAYDKYDSKYQQTRATVPSAVWFGGLIGVEMYKATMKKKHLNDAKKDLLKLQKWKKVGCLNSNHMALLLEAEINAASEISNSVKLFMEAIDAANASDYAHDRALANERAAIHCLANNDTAKACDLMIEATRMYNRWNATAKVTQIHSKYPYLFYDQNSAVSSRKSSKKANDRAGVRPVLSATTMLLSSSKSGIHNMESRDMNVYSRRHQQVSRNASSTKLPNVYELN
jgi:predicted ATPase